MNNLSDRYGPCARVLSPAQREHKAYMQREKRKTERSAKQEAYRARQESIKPKEDDCWKWDRALNGRQYETMIMKGDR